MKKSSKKYILHNSFTMLELVFVIVVVGILAATIIPNTKTNPLQEAALQVVSHIRYTQHLAMVDDKFNASDPIWYKKRWQLKFSKAVVTENKWSYVIFSDRSGGGNPDSRDIAVNPLDRNKKLTGGSAGASMIHTGDDEATEEMNIGKTYGVLDVDFSSACRTGATSKNILFDHLGRPLRGKNSNYVSAYDSGSATNALIDAGCTITICSVLDCKNASNDEKVTIAIENETGYTRIL